MPHIIVQDTPKHEDFAKFQALAPSGFTRLDDDVKQKDMANVTPGTLASTFLGIFRQTLYGPSILLNAEHAITPKLATTKMLSNEAVRTRKGTV